MEMEIFVQHLLKHKDKCVDGIHHFFKCAKQETLESKEAYDYVHKYLKGEKLTEEESHVVKEQFFDLLKSIGIIIPFAVIPGASILIPVVVKLCDVLKIDYNGVLPTAFQIHEEIKVKINEININEDENSFIHSKTLLHL